MTWFMGIDIGSSTCKGVLLNNEGVEEYYSTPSGNQYAKAAQVIRDGLLKKAGVLENEIAGVVSTGHGAGLVPFSERHVDPVWCCGKGMNYVLPSVRTVIDLQNQSVQVIVLGNNGQVLDLVVSEKCATGSGVFVDIVANVLQITVEDIGPLSLKSVNPVVFSTGCAVFGESETVSRVAEGVAKEDILAGVHNAITGVIINLTKRLDPQHPFAISGGGGLNIGLIHSLEKAGIELLVPPNPEFVNAIGAALIARNAD